MIKINDTNISGVYVGNASASSIYLGSTQVWSATAPHDYSQDYFTLVVLESGTIKWAMDNLEYSLNDGAWTAWNRTNGLAVSVDDKVRFRSSTNTSYNNVRINYGKEFEAEGNIMSLLYGDNFVGQSTLSQDRVFRRIFYLSKVVNAENLILPATTLATNSYDEMFLSCTSLTKAPVILATSLANYCCRGMFNGCTSLTEAPALPATTLAPYCYDTMFNGCTSLTKAPLLPATILESCSYQNLFNGCTSLNFIKCLATDISKNGCLNNWVLNVSATGTFVKDASMSAWPTGSSGIPDNWTVQDA